MSQTQIQKLPEWSVDQWFNTADPISLSALQGKVVVLTAFQMLCPGCVSHALPLAQQTHDTFPQDQVAMIGLHTVFEHHAAMAAVSLEAFLQEYRITFPVGIATPGKDGLPVTMETYKLRGTPSLLLIDKAGHLRSHSFGHVSALSLGAQIATLMNEVDTQTETQMSIVSSRYDPTGCQAG